MAVTFPFSLKPSELDFYKSNSTGPELLTMTGNPVSTIHDAGFWRARMSFQIVNEEMRLALRAFSASVNGRATEILLPVFPEDRPEDRNGRPIPRMTRVPFAPVPGLGGNPGGTFELFGMDMTEPVWMKLEKRAELRDTEIMVDFTGTLGLRPGHYFSINNRLHVVAEAVTIRRERKIRKTGKIQFKGANWTFGGQPVTFGGSFSEAYVGDNIQRVKIWPPMREEALKGTQLIVGDPFCRMRLTDEEGLSAALQRGRWGSINVSFRESF